MTRKTREFPITITSLGKLVRIRAVNIRAALEQAKLIEIAAQKAVKELEKEKTK